MTVEFKEANDSKYTGSNPLKIYINKKPYVAIVLTSGPNPRYIKNNLNGGAVIKYKNIYKEKNTS